MAAASFEYLVRFADEGGNIVYGNISEEKAPESLVGSRLDVLEGDVYKGFKSSNRSAVVHKVCVIFQESLQ